MKYLILIYHGRNQPASLSPADMERGRKAHRDLVDDLSASGELVVAEVLVGPEEGRRVSVSGGAVTVTDGPFAEAKEHLAGVYVVEAKDLDRAIEQAARIPEAAGGLVEVREVAVEAVPGEGWRSPAG